MAWFSGTYKYYKTQFKNKRIKNLLIVTDCNWLQLVSGIFVKVQFLSFEKYRRKAGDSSGCRNDQKRILLQYIVISFANSIGIGIGI